MPTNLKQNSDDELCAMLRGERTLAHAAFDEFYARHSARVYTYCCRMVGKGSLAQDMFQETFIRFYKSVQSEATMSNAGAYLLRIARNICLNERSRKHHQSAPFDEFQFPVVQDSLESTELLGLIETALETMTDEYRDAIVLREFLGLSHDEIAAIAGTSAGVIRTRVYRAKNRLREILAPYLEDLQK